MLIDIFSSFKWFKHFHLFSVPYMHMVNTDHLSFMDKENTHSSFSFVKDEITTFRYRTLAHIHIYPACPWSIVRQSRTCHHSMQNLTERCWPCYHQSCNWSPHELPAHYTLHQRSIMAQNPEILKTCPESDHNNKTILSIWEPDILKLSPDVINQNSQKVIKKVAQKSVSLWKRDLCNLITHTDTLLPNTSI